MFSESFVAHLRGLDGVESVDIPDGLPGPRYNIGPTQKIAAVRIEESVATVLPARWGLLPHWKKDETGPPLFNARGETVANKPSFRDAFNNKDDARWGGRCLIPMDGYYEWCDIGDGDGKWPYYVRREDGLPLIAAGLWATGLDQLSATIVTTDSAEPIAWLHDRLPRFLLDEEIDSWLHSSLEKAEQMLHPTPQPLREKLVATKAAKEVGNVRNDYAGLIADV